MKLQRTLPLLLLLALLAGYGTSSQPSALTAEERTQSISAATISGLAPVKIARCQVI